jgi:hypothetical protein
MKKRKEKKEMIEAMWKRKRPQVFKKERECLSE